MTDPTHVQTPPGTAAIILSRMFLAPRRKLWAAFVEPRQLALWLGPDGFPARIGPGDIRSGRVLDLAVRGADDLERSFRVGFDEVGKFERLIGWAEEQTGAGFGRLNATVTFEQRDGRTLVTILALVADEETRDRLAADGAIDFARQALDRLEALLATRH